MAQKLNSNKIPQFVDIEKLNFMEVSLTTLIVARLAFCRQQFMDFNLYSSATSATNCKS